MRGLILSAGLGERLRPLTVKRAKPAIEFLNIPMLGFPYYWLNTLKLDALVFNTHHLPDSIRHAAMHVVSPNVPMFFSHEDTILGSGGGICKARPYLEGDASFAVANGDGVVLCEELDTLEQMAEFHAHKDALATFLVCPLEGVGTRLPGVWMDNTGEVAGFGKSSPVPYAECLHYASYMLLSKRIWDYLPEGSSNIIYDVIEPQIKKGERVYGYRVDNMRWFETGNAAEYLAATRQSLECLRDGGRLGDCARDIVTKLAPAFELHSDLSRLRLIADSAQIEDLSALQGFAVVGADCRVQSPSRLQDGVLLPGTSLNAGDACVHDIRI
jgi:mannose-1-phosphate guanylyltransferase